MSSVQHVLVILFGWFVRGKVNGHAAAVLLGAASRIVSKQYSCVVPI